MMAAGLAALACSENESLVGKWVQAVPGMPRAEQGFVLEADGSAESVNMASMVYETWKEQDGRLILSGKSIGNHQTFGFSDTLVIERHTRDSLILRKGLLKLKYARKANDENRPRPAKGILTIGHETRCLRMWQDTNDYWIVDKTGNLYRQYDSITEGVKNGRPVYAELQVMDAGCPQDGFAEGYDRVLQVVGIDAIVPCGRDMRLFAEGIRTESASGGGETSAYILFGKDSLYADICRPESGTEKRLMRHTLPDGRHVWNVEDDDTENLGLADGCWTVSRRGRTLFRQLRSDNDGSLGPWVEERFEGEIPDSLCPGTAYLLLVRHREHSGDGQFFLRCAGRETDSGNDAGYTCTGRRYTLRGTPSDNDATVWRLVSDNDGRVFNFLYGADGHALTLLDDKFEIAGPVLNSRGAK